MERMGGMGPEYPNIPVPFLSSAASGGNRCPTPVVSGVRLGQKFYIPGWRRYEIHDFVVMDPVASINESEIWDDARKMQQKISADCWLCASFSNKLTIKFIQHIGR